MADWTYVFLSCRASALICMAVSQQTVKISLISRANSFWCPLNGSASGTVSRLVRPPRITWRGMREERDGGEWTEPSELGWGPEQVLSAASPTDRTRTLDWTGHARCPFLLLASGDTAGVPAPAITWSVERCSQFVLVPSCTIQGKYEIWH